MQEISYRLPLTQLGAWAAREVAGSYQVGYSGFVPAMFTEGQSPENRGVNDRRLGC